MLLLSAFLICLVYEDFSLHSIIVLQVIQELNLLPFKVEEIEQKVNAFRNYSDEIRRSLPDILLATMTILYTQYRNTK